MTGKKRVIRRFSAIKVIGIFAAIGALLFVTTQFSEKPHSDGPHQDSVLTDSPGDGYLARTMDDEIGNVPELDFESGNFDGVAQDSETATSESTIDYEEVECVDFASYSVSADAQTIDEWYLSWGAPPLLNDNLGTRPYTALSEEQLTGLATSGDAEAIQELGMNKIWRAFHNERRMPDYATIWDAGSDEHPFRSNISQKLLEEGRKHLYDAAIQGDVHAFVDIALSFSQELSAARKAGRLTLELQEALSISAASYAAIPEDLIDGLHRGFVSTGIDENLKPVAESSRRNIVDQYKVDRIDAGLSDLPVLKAPAELRSIPDFCRS